MAKLGDICTLNMGQSPDSATYNEVGKGLPFFQGNADFGRLHPTVRVWCSEPTKIAHTGDILISVRAPIGAMNIANQDCCVGRGLAAIQVNENICDPQYLWYSIQAKVGDLNLKGTGSTFKAISKGTLADTEILLVPLDVQKNIAKILSNVENTILFRKEQFTKLDELVKARFVEMFGDFEYNPKNFPIYPLCSLCDVGSSKRIYQEEQSISGIPFLKISDLVDLIDTGTFSASTFIPSDRYEELCSQELTPKANDVLITSRGTLGKCYIVRKSDKFYFQDGMISWLSNISEKISSTYISYLFMQPYIQKQISVLQAGSTVAYLSISMLKRLNIILPPLPLQNQFAAFVEGVDKSKVEVQKALDQTQLLFDSLMQQYFG